MTRFKISKISILIPMIITVTNCVTPMSRSEIENVTTCKNVTLKKVRKNLLLAGYEIEQNTEEDLTTTWKQTSGFTDSKSFVKIIAVKIDNETIKFKVRKRETKVTQENQLSFTNSKESRNSGTSRRQTIGFGRNIERHSDYDQTYYKEYLESYLNIRQDVCG